MPIESADCVVIGSGPGGAVAAHALNEAGKDFLLLESGPRIATAAVAPFSTEEMKLKYRNGGLSFAWGSPKIPFAEGNVVGGGSEINSGIYHRTTPDVLSKWRMQNQILNFENDSLNEHFQFNENLLKISISQKPVSEAAKKLQLGASALKWECREAASWFHFPDRRSMSETFLKSIGPRLRAQAEVIGFKRQKDNWLVKFKTNRSAVSEIRTKNIFMAGGSVSTPWLLQKNLSIPNVGKSLQIHPTVKVTARFSGDVSSDIPQTPAHQVRGFGPGMSIGCSVSTQAFLASAMLDHPDHFTYVTQNWKKMATYYGSIQPKSIGKVFSYPFSGKPAVRLQLEKSDFDGLLCVMEALVKIMFEAGAIEVFPHAANFGAVSSLAEFLEKKRKLKPIDLRVMTIHLFSGCPMGEASHCPADSFGKLKAAPGIYINDASLLPGAPGVNPQGTIMALSRRNILHFLAGDKS